MDRQVSHKPAWLNPSTIQNILPSTHLLFISARVTGTFAPADLLKSLFMHLNIKPYLIILTSVILLLILFACFRNLGFEKQVAEWGRKNAGIMKGILVVLFLVFGAAAVPVFLKAFLAMQTRIGNGDLPLVKLLREHALGIIYTAWIIFGLGLVIALPMMIKNGYLSNTP